MICQSVLLLIDLGMHEVLLGLRHKQTGTITINTGNFTLSKDVPRGSPHLLTKMTRGKTRAFCNSWRDS